MHQARAAAGTEAVNRTNMSLVSVNFLLALAHCLSAHLLEAKIKALGFWGRSWGLCDPPSFHL